MAYLVAHRGVLAHQVQSPCPVQNGPKPARGDLATGFFKGQFFCPRQFPAYDSNPCLDGAIRLSKFVLKLYVTGSTPRTQLAISNLRRICEAELGAQYDLEIIDVLEHPQVAEDQRILATPTLVKQLPPPLRRVIGDLSDREKVLFGLELLPGDRARGQSA
jgi:circadian clock protein KaiB